MYEVVVFERGTVCYTRIKSRARRAYRRWAGRARGVMMFRNGVLVKDALRRELTVDVS